MRATHRSRKIKSGFHRFPGGETFKFQFQILRTQFANKNRFIRKIASGNPLSEKRRKILGTFSHPTPSDFGISAP